MKGKGCLTIILIILTVIILILIYPWLQELPFLKGVDLPNLGFGVGGIGDGLRQIFEGITRSIKF